MDTSELLQQLGYNPPQADGELSLDRIQNAGLSDGDYRDLVCWLAQTIKQYAPQIDETISSPNDLHSFAMEISSFLKELNCPYHVLLDGPVSARYRSEADSKLLVDFLTGEAVAGVIGQHKRNEELKHQIDLSQPSETPSDILVEILRKLSLDVSCDETKVTGTDIFDQIIHRLNDHPDGPDLLFRPSTKLSDDQWTRLDQCHTDLQEEYDLRMTMMMTRLDVTMQAFQWKRDTKLDVAQIWRQRRRILSALMTKLNRKDISDLLVAEQNLLTMEKIASARIMGNRKNVFQGDLKLPNRGGVVSIHAKPHMPVWSSREEGQPCENLRKKQSKVPNPEPNKTHQRIGKKAKRRQRMDSGDIEEN